MIEITGTLYSYYFLCSRKMWLYYHHISFESEHINVRIGKDLDENSYLREKHGIDIDGFAKIDYIKNNVVYEVKKSDNQSQMAINQLKYYLYLLRQKGLKMSGQINYPLLKKTTSVELLDSDITEIENNLAMVKSGLSMAVPPAAERKSYCKSCAYFDFCFS